MKNVRESIADEDYTWKFLDNFAKNRTEYHTSLKTKEFPLFGIIKPSSIEDDIEDGDHHDCEHHEYIQEEYKDEVPYHLRNFDDK